MSVKCKINGEPLTVKHKVLPVPGTVREAVAGEFKGATIQHPDRAGECPECRGYVPLSSKGFITAHIEHNEPAPASVELTDTSVQPTDTGARVGDPDAGNKRRGTELDGAYERGTVQAPVKGENGRTKLTEVPATADNVRKALEYWKGRSPRSDAGRAEQSRMVSELARRLDALRKGKGLFKAEERPEGFTQFMLPGAPLVKGRNMPPVQPMRRNKATGQLEPSSIGTMGGNIGRERLDREVADPRPVPHRTPSQRSNYRRKMRRLAAKGL